MANCVKFRLTHFWKSILLQPFTYFKFDFDNTFILQKYNLGNVLDNNQQIGVHHIIIIYI